MKNEEFISKNRITALRKEVENRLNNTLITERDTYYNLGKLEIIDELLQENDK